MEQTDARTIFQAVGGAETFDRVVERFYAGVAANPVLRPMYHPALDESRRRLSLFLQQYFGGPAAYSEERGHPRLRMRHAPFVVGEPERDAWLRHMNAALDALVTERGIDPQIEARMLEYFAMAADAMINAR